MVNISETRNEGNSVQLITVFVVEKNNVHDTTFLRRSSRWDQRSYEIYVDGGYYSEDLINGAEEADIDLHFTNMTGTASNKDKLSIKDFVLFYS